MVDILSICLWGMRLWYLHFLYTVLKIQQTSLLSFSQIHFRRVESDGLGQDCSIPLHCTGDATVLPRIRLWYPAGRYNSLALSHQWDYNLSLVAMAGVIGIRAVRYHHKRHGIWNHWQMNCLFNSLFQLITKKVSKLPLWGESMGDLLLGPVTQKASWGPIS